MAQYVLETTRSSYMLAAKYVSCCHHGMSFVDVPSQVYGCFMLTWHSYAQYNRVERLPALHYSVDLIFFSFEIMGLIVEL